MSWLDSHPSEEEKVYEDKFKEMEDKASPVMQLLHGQPEAEPDMGTAGSSVGVEEVD